MEAGPEVEGGSDGPQVLVFSRVWKFLPPSVKGEASSHVTEAQASP